MTIWQSLSPISRPHPGVAASPKACGLRLAAAPPASYGWRPPAGVCIHETQCRNLSRALLRRNHCPSKANNQTECDVIALTCNQLQH